MTDHNARQEGLTDAAINSTWKDKLGYAITEPELTVVRAILAHSNADASNEGATLFCDLKTDTEKANFFLSGRGYATGVISRAIQNDVAMAYQRCATRSASARSSASFFSWASRSARRVAS